MPSSRRSKLPDVAIVGAGTLATALAVALRKHGFPVSEIVTRDHRDSLRRARQLASRVRSRAVTLSNAEFTARILWICVPDDAISEVANQIAKRGGHRGKIVLHSSGALASDVLDPLRLAGAAVGSAHPLMTFVSSSLPGFRGVPFALEGDLRATAAARTIIRRLGGKPFSIGADSKPAYHAFGFFSAPAVVALIAAAEEVGKLAGLSNREARRLMQPIVRTTIENCFKTTPQQAFSGPVRRGDVATIRKHVDVLKNQPELLELYRALVEIALKKLPSANESAIRKLITFKNVEVD